MRRRTALIALALLCACGRFSMPDSEYLYFEIVSPPEERVWYPEETMTIVFNGEIAPDTVPGAVVISYEGDPAHGSTVTAVDDTLRIAGLLPDATITVTIASGLKSTDNKPLVQKSEDGYATATQAFTRTIGPALPAVAKIIPGDHLRSRNIGIVFTTGIATDSAAVSPQPDGMTVQGNMLLLSFDTPPAQVTLSGIAATTRPGAAPDMTLSLTDTPPVSEDAEIATTPQDTTATVAIAATGLVAALLDGDLALCEKECRFLLEGLAPDASYDLDLTLYFTDRVETTTLAVATLPPVPHIMISEVMHTPAGTPEKSWEFVELYNHGELDFDLSLCTIDDNGDGAGEDPLTPLVENDLILQPGDFALILGGGSQLHLSIDTHPHIYFVDDTTIADNGLTSTESVSIHCLTGEDKLQVAHYDGLFRKADRGYSVVIDTTGRVCASAEPDGSPGTAESCPE
ncbi:MAG TPA: lamin tail domain-containing protein [bacterium]|nr:lamin tail domain-containing protein [bacterium]